MNNFYKFLIKKRTFLYLILFILLILLLIREYHSHDPIKSHSQLENENRKNKEQNKSEEFYNTEEDNIFQNSKLLLNPDMDLKNHYNSIINFLEEYEEPLYNKKTINGCYDNDILMEQIKGPGNTCKLIGREVQNIFKKSKEKGDIHNFVDNFGNQLSFAEICPVTSNMSRPLECLYDKNKNIKELGYRTSNVIDTIQNIHKNKLNKLNSNVDYHIDDFDRLYNSEIVRNYLNHEKKNQMNKDIQKNIFDIISDLEKYSVNVKREFE